MASTRNRCVLRGAAVLLPVSLFALATAWAQGGVTSSGELEIGARQLFGNRASAKFLEYGSMPEGLFLSSMNLKFDWGESGYFLTFRAKDALEGDQSIALRAGRRGRYELSVDFDKTPHRITTTGRTLYLTESPGVYTLPDEVRSSLRTIFNTDTDPGTPGTQRDLAALDAVIGGLSRPVDFTLTREKGRAQFRYTPDPSWDLRVQYALEETRGLRPIGATFGFNAQEQAEPIDYATHEVRGSVERSGAKWVVQAGYAGTFFRNHVDALVWDNPFRETPSLDGTAARGRIDLYPNNAAHQGTVTAGLVLPLQGRWNTTLAYGVMTQDDDFLPFTINEAVSGVPTLPAASARGKFQTLHVSSSVNLRPAPDLRLTARYRYYDRDNETPRLIFSDYVRTDDRLSGTARGSMPYAYTRQDAGFDAAWQPAPGISLKGGYAWEGWDREFRETHSTDETTWKGAVDVNHGGWLFLRAAYRRSDRDGSEYSAHHVAELMFPAGEPGAGQLEALRKLDQADRRRDRAEFIARVTPDDRVSVSATYSLTEDDYHNSEYGRLENSNHTVAVELAYSPAPAVSVFADYARSLDKTKQRSRERSPSFPDDPINDWETMARDPLDTFGGGVIAELAGGKVDLNVNGHVSLAETQTRTSANPATTRVTAVDFPLVENDFYFLDASIRYHLSARTALRLVYRLERYDQTDFGTDPMQPFMGFVEEGAAGTTWVGATRPDYRAHIISLGVLLRL